MAMMPNASGEEADLVEHARVHRSAAAGAAREGRGRLRRDGHAPWQVGRRPQRELGQEAAEPADGERQRDRGSVVVAGREGVPERPLAQDDRHVAADQAADDAARPVGDDVGDRQIRRLDLVDDLPARQEPSADRPAGEGGHADDDDLRAEDPVAPERAVVEGDPAAMPSTVKMSCVKKVRGPISTTGSMTQAAPARAMRPPAGMGR